MRLQVVQASELVIITTTTSYQRVSFSEIPAPEPEPAPEPGRPPTRGSCEGMPRPCPFVSCRYNLYLDIRGDGVLRVNFPDREPDEMLASCALDLAEDGPRTLDAVAGLMGMSKERARQIEAVAMAKLQKALGTREYHDLNGET